MVASSKQISNKLGPIRKGVMKMELNKVEVSVVEDAATKAKDSQLRELNELQLSTVGGGIGETVL